MGSNFKKRSFELGFTALFLCLVAFFTFFRLEIADYAAGLLALTHEIQLSEKKVGESRATLKITTHPQISTIKKPVAAKAAVSNKFKNPVTLKLPKTKTPIITFSSNLPSWDNARFPTFPNLRKYNGDEWTKEKTKFKISTDGNQLYIIGRLYDKDPVDAITQYTKKDNNKMVWKDDSIEIFLMKDRKSKIYCQYIVSVSGSGCFFYNKLSNQPNTWTTTKPPANFKTPRFDADKAKGGFELDLRISLSNIGIQDIKTGDSFLMQIVRNYRGQGGKDSVTLQLFPVFIYADSRMGINNHDRRAFQPVKISIPEGTK